MKLNIKVTPKSSRREFVKKDGQLKAYLRSAPEKGKANKELIDLIAKEYKIPKSSVVIVSGLTGRNKIVEVPDKWEK